MKVSSSITLIHIVDGKDGISVISFEAQFSKSNSVNNIPTSNWVDTIPQRNEGEIIWKREVITYSNASTKILTPHPITGDKGDTGTPGDISIGLGYKINHTNLTSSNDGEIFAHGFNNGVAADIDGWIYFQGIKYTVLKGYCNPGSVYNDFPYNAYVAVRKSPSSKIVAIRFDCTTKTFKFIDSENSFTGTVVENDWFIVGEFGMTNGEYISHAFLYPEGKSLQTIKEKELLEKGELVIKWSSNSITIKSLDNRGFISYNNNRVYIPGIHKTFSKSGNGVIIANISTGEIKFCRMKLGTTTYNNQSVDTIDFCDFETDSLIINKHSSLTDFSYIKIGQFKINSSLLVETAILDSIESLSAYLMKSFMDILKNQAITQDNFEKWLNALDLKNFYETLIASSLFANVFIANRAQIMDRIKISADNIEGTLNDENIDKERFFRGLALNSDGSIKANWKGLDPDGFPISGWMVDGEGKSYFQGTYIKDAIFNELKATKIGHPALETFDEVEGRNINQVAVKDEFKGLDYFDQFESNHINETNLGITIDGISYDRFVKHIGSDIYEFSDTNSYSTRVEAGLSYYLHTWKNNTNVPLYVEGKASIDGSFNGIWWKVKRVNNNVEWFDESKHTFGIIYPGETLICEAASWAWWGAQYARVYFVRFYKTFYSGLVSLLDYTKTTTSLNVSSGADSSVTQTLASFTIPSWCNYVLFEIYRKDSSDNNNTNYIALSNGGKLVVNLYVNGRNYGYTHMGAHRIILQRECEAGDTIEIKMSITGGTDSDGKAYSNVFEATSFVKAFGIRRGNNYNFINRTSGQIKSFNDDEYYQNAITISSKSSLTSSYLTKCNTLNYIINKLVVALGASNLNKWINIKEGTTPSFLIDGVSNPFVQIFVSASSVLLKKSDGSVVNALSDVRYNSISLVLQAVSAAAHVKTKSLLPSNGSSTLGDSDNKYVSGYINNLTSNVINATEVHGKVYAS